MASVSISFTLEGEKQVSAMIHHTGKKLSDLKKPLSRARDLLLKTFDTNFDTKGATLGEPWKKRKKSYPWPILQKTKRMRKGFKSEVHKLHTILWNPTPYFKYHQSNKPRVRLPRRVMMKIDKKRRDEIFRFFTQYLDEVNPHFKKL